MAEARLSLAEGDPRRALELLRQVQFRDSKREDLSLWFFCAGVQRERQLLHKGLVKEAAAIGARARQHGAAIAVQGLADEDLVHYLRHVTGSEALAVYAAHLTTRPPLPAAERAVADRTVIDRCWERLAVLPAEHPLRRDAPPVQRSLEAMDTGQWERAEALLRAVPRRSPYAPWRLFCKAMVGFGADDDQGLQRAVALLPEDFALRHTVAEFRRQATGGGRDGHDGHDERAVPAIIQRELGTGQPPVEPLVASLRQAITDAHLPEIERQLVKLAEAVYPEDPVQARMALVQVISLATLRDLPATALDSLARRVLPRERVDGVMAQGSLLAQQITHAFWDPTAAAIFCDALSDVFPDAADQKLARGCVLESLARNGARNRIDRRPLSERHAECLTHLLGEPPQDAQMVLIDLMMASLAADPEHDAGFRFLLELIRRCSVDDKRRLLGVLDELVVRYPDAPEPWLELATLQYSRNAYRRAEAALAEARQRAPQDERVLDLQAIAFLKSADQSRKSGRFSLAARDLERAAALRRPLGPLLRVKRILLEVVTAGVDGGAEAAAVAAPQLELLAPAERLRTLSVLLHDLEQNIHNRNVDPDMAHSLRQLLTRTAGACGQLAPDEVLELLAPLPDELRVLYADLQIAPVLRDWWGPLMARVDGDALLTCFDTLLRCGGWGPVRAELDRRLGGRRSARRDPLLLFYLAVIRYREGQDRDGRRFREIVDQADAGSRERLRGAAVRLAALVDGPLRFALQEFEFEVLDVPALPFPDPWYESLDDEDLEDEDLEDDEHEVARPAHGTMPPAAAAAPSVPELPAALRGAVRDGRMDLPDQRWLFDEVTPILQTLEEMIDGAALRGAPRVLLQELADSVRTDPELAETLDDVAELCTATNQRSRLSRELEVLLFGARGATRRGKGRK